MDLATLAKMNIIDGADEHFDNADIVTNIYIASVTV